MKTTLYENREAWLAGRIGRITGSRLKDIIVKRGTGKKIGFYELIVERLALPSDGENPMDRGTRLESEALDRFEKETGKTVDRSLVIWERDDNTNIAISPDGFIGDEEAVEVKCLASARHIEALLTQDHDYQEQGLQYFIVNDNLKVLHFAFYDPRLKFKDFHIITIKREDVQSKVDEILAYERDVLTEVEMIVNKLSF